jgi:RimJ/RimL family protein N-acetyltransferase
VSAHREQSAPLSGALDARLAVTPFTSPADYLPMLDYFLGADERSLQAMGVDPKKLPRRDAWLARLLPDLTRPDSLKQTFYLGWDYQGSRIGHCNLNPLRYGAQAGVHLHLWDAGARSAGLGTELLRLSISVFFQRFALQRLYCEPYAHNPAPNRVLTKAGFRWLERYRTTPGLICFEQKVNRYVMQRPVAGDLPP